VERWGTQKLTRERREGASDEPFTKLSKDHKLASIHPLIRFDNPNSRTQ